MLAVPYLWKAKSTSRIIFIKKMGSIRDDEDERLIRTDTGYGRNLLLERWLRYSYTPNSTSDRDGRGEDTIGHGQSVDMSELSIRTPVEGYIRRPQ